MEKKLLIVLLIASLFLNLYKITDFFPFIGDQGWFYLSARDMVTKEEIPLVGITSSHTWVNQGPFWTYVLALVFLLFGFNPAIPAIFTGAMGSLSVLLFYLIVKKLFSGRVAFFSSLIFAFSPLVILSFRMPYHTTLIPIFSILFAYSLYKWVTGYKYFFVLSVFLLSILYNFELATQSLWGLVFLILIYGFYKKKSWFKDIFNTKIAFFSLAAFILPLIPVAIYDLNHGFYQTIKFYGWMTYSVLKPEGSFDLQEYFKILNFLGEKARMFIFPVNKLIALCFFGFSFLILFFRKNRLKKNETLVYLCIIFILAGIFVTKTPSDAYIPPLFPYIAVFFGITIEKIFNFNKLIALLIIGISIFINAFDLLRTDYYTILKIGRTIPYAERKEISQKIIRIANKRKFLLKTYEPVPFKSYTMNYKYILWWMGNEPVEKNAELVFYINEKQNSIELTYRDEK